MQLQDHTGKQVPETTFKIRKGHEWQEKTTADYFKGKKVVLFGLPGAFTPTCSSTHLPRYQELIKTFKSEGIDDVICLSVNDSFVMNAWQKSQNTPDITMLPDGNGEFTEKLGLLVDKSDLGFGKRTWRYSMLVNDGKIEKMFLENETPGDPFSKSDATTMLKHINPDIVIPKSVTIYTRPGCPHCFDAKSLLKSEGIDYEEHSLNRDYSLKTLIALTGGTQVPQIFMNGEKIGGSEDLKKLIAKS